MTSWISWNIDIPRSVNSRDSCPTRKFKNQAPTSCRPCPILSLPTVTFELHAKIAEEIDLEKRDFPNFRSSVTLTLHQVEVILVRICGRGLPINQIRSKLEKLFVDIRTDGWTNTLEFSKSIRSLPSDNLKNYTLKTFWCLYVASYV